MSITTQETPDGRIRILIDGRFDFSSHQAFSKAYKQYPPGEHQYEVDLSDANYLDSSAMGMLLQLREHSSKTKGSVVIKNPDAGVKEILRIANFDKLFQVEG